MRKRQMFYTGTLIDDLMAAVERAEEKARAIESQEIEPWMAAMQESATYESELVEVA